VKKLIDGAFVEIHAPINPIKITVDEKGNAWIVNAWGEIFSYTEDGWIIAAGDAIDIGAGSDGTSFYLTVYGELK